MSSETKASALSRRSFIGIVGAAAGAAALGSLDLPWVSEAHAEEGVDRYLVWNLTSEPASWDPTTNSASIADYMCTQMFEGLTYPTVDGFEPGVAETWDVSEDGLTYTFHLRDNAKWSDGSPVTAHDFEYSWKRICDPAVASDALQAMTDYVQGAQEFFDGTGSRDDVKATAIDDYTFEVTLKNPAPFFPELVANDVYMPVKQDVVEANGEGWEKDPATCISNGPFKMTEYNIGDSFVFEKNEHYWNADSVKLKGIRAVLIDDENTSLQAYQSGELDCTETLPTDQIPQLLATDPNLVISPDTGCNYLFFNCDKAPFDDFNVRKAITLAIDRKSIVEQVTQAGEIPATGILAPTAQKTDGSSYRELDAFGYPVPEYDIDPNQAQIDLAKQYLSDAGYPDGEGFPEFELLYASSEKNRKVMEAIQSQLSTNLGMSVTLRSEESNVYSTTGQQGDFEVCRGGWTNVPFDAGGLIKQFTSTNGNNFSQWRWQEYAGAPWDTTLNPGNQAFDEAYNKAMASQGAERDAAWVEAEQALMADLPCCPLFYPTQAYVIGPKVSGVVKSKSLRWIFKGAICTE